MSNPKELRRAIRNVVQDLFPEILTKEVADAIHKKLSEELKERLDLIQKNVEEALKQMDQRSKDIQGYIVRQSTANSKLMGVPDEPKQ